MDDSFLDTDGNRWYGFNRFTPAHCSMIIVEDHEGNLATGVWFDDNGFQKGHGFPLGFPVRWTGLQVGMVKNGDGDLRAVYKYESGKTLCREEMFDDAPIFPEQVNEET